MVNNLDMQRPQVLNFGHSVSQRKQFYTICSWKRVSLSYFLSGTTPGQIPPPKLHLC